MCACVAPARTDTIVPMATWKSLAYIVVTYVLIAQTMHKCYASKSSYLLLVNFRQKDSCWHMLYSLRLHCLHRALMFVHKTYATFIDTTYCSHRTAHQSVVCRSSKPQQHIFMHVCFSYTCVLSQAIKAVFDSFGAWFCSNVQ